MSKILLALTILGAGAGGLILAHQSTTKLTNETIANRAALLVQTEQLAATQGEKADLAERMRELKASLARQPAVVENTLWSELQKNKGRADWLPPELRQRVLEELGFDWQFSPDYVVVTKQAVRDTGAWMLGDGKLSDVAAAIFTMTPDERKQVEAAMQRAQADFNDWVLANVERSEPKDDVVAHYSLPGYPSNSNSLFSSLSDALGKGRTGIIQSSEEEWSKDIGIGSRPASILVRRGPVGNEQVLKVELVYPSGNTAGGNLAEYLRNFPATFRPLFPNGWADVAKREGFELPPPVGSENSITGQGGSFR